jgi:phosphate-selective porin
MTSPFPASDAGTRFVTVLLALGFLAAWAAGPASAQELELETTGLLRTGFRVESSRYDGARGFEIYDARLGLAGKVGIVFDYALQAEYHFDDAAVRLLDASLSVPLKDEALRLDVGLLASGFGREATKSKDLLPLVERSQGSLALAPGRQVGAAVRGQAFEQRLTYRGGLYNGEGASFGNFDRGFLFAARAAWNSAGEVEFFEDFVYELGADVAFASDSVNEVLPVSRAGVFEIASDAAIPGYAAFTGDRVVWSADAGLRWRSWSVAGEYGRAEYTPSGTVPRVSSEAWFVEGGYALWGAFDLLLRYDSFRAAVGAGVEADRTEFLVFGLNINPGFHARMGLQYSVGLDGSLVGVSQAIDGTNTGPALADDQFLLNLQLAF